jgi:hypothetical protein
MNQGGRRGDPPGSHAQERMEVDAALPGRRFITVEYVRRRNRQMHRGRPQLSEATQIEEGGVTLTIPGLHGDVVDQTTLMPRANSQRRLSSVRMMFGRSNDR